MSATKTSMSRRDFFLKSALPDFLLVLIVSVTLSLTVSYGFDSAAAVRGNVIIHVVTAAVMLLVLFAGSWSKAALLPSIAGTAVLVVAIVGASMVLTPSDTPMFVDSSVNDNEGSYLIFGVILALVPIITYLLSRRRVGVVILAIGGVLTYEIIQYLYRDWVSNESGTIVALIGIVALFALLIFQGYRSNLYAATRVRQARFGQAAAFGVALSVACVAVGVVVFVAIIANLGLQTPEIKPFKDYYQKPVVEYTGVYSEQQVDSPDLTTNQINDRQNESNQDAEGGQTTQSPQDNQDQGAAPQSEAIQFMSAFDPSNWNTTFNAINYTQLALTASLLIVVVVAAFALAIYLKKRSRKKRLERLADESYSYRVWFLYEFLVKRMAKIGIKRPVQMTLLEYAMASRSALAPFSQGTDGVDFLAITLAYQRACYAGHMATEEDYRNIAKFYNAFFDNARRYVGSRKWLILFWIL